MDKLTCKKCGADMHLLRKDKGYKNLGTEEEPDIKLVSERMFKCLDCNYREITNEIL